MELISREQAIDHIRVLGGDDRNRLMGILANKEILPTIESRIRCKDCKYYHEDFWGDIEGLPMPIIITHQVCTKWGGGCKTIENGYCHFGEMKALVYDRDQYEQGYKDGKADAISEIEALIQDMRGEE